MIEVEIRGDSQFVQKNIERYVQFFSLLFNRAFVQEIGCGSTEYECCFLVCASDPELKLSYKDEGRIGYSWVVNYKGQEVGSFSGKTPWKSLENDSQLYNLLCGYISQIRLGEVRQESPKWYLRLFRKPLERPKLVWARTGDLVS